MIAERRRCEHVPCGRPYPPRRKDQRFCSRWCKRAAWTVEHRTPFETAEEPFMESPRTDVSFRSVEEFAGALGGV